VYTRKSSEEGLADASAGALTGIAVSFVNYLAELP
jgi:hypothetical protein